MIGGEIDEFVGELELLISTPELQQNKSLVRKLSDALNSLKRTHSIFSRLTEEEWEIIDNLANEKD
jgi:hypothetical protein